MKLVIDRSKWFRGQGGKDSKLIRRDDGKMCCLGFFGLACGIDKSGLYDQADPESVPSDVYGGWPDWIADPTSLARRQTDDTNRLIRANDDQASEEARREELIKQIFAEHGVEVEFIDGEGA